MGLFMKESSRIIKFKEQEAALGQMEESKSANGNSIKWAEKGLQ